MFSVQHGTARDLYQICIVWPGLRAVTGLGTLSPPRRKPGTKAKSFPSDFDKSFLKQRCTLICIKPVFLFVLADYLGFLLSDRAAIPVAIFQVQWAEHAVHGGNEPLQPRGHGRNHHVR